MAEHSGALRSRCNKKGWWRDFFLDIPDNLATGIEQFYGSVKSNKTKVYCQRCFEHHVTQAFQHDDRGFLSGALSEKRTRATIERDLWTSNSRHIRSSAVQTLLNHLKDCDLQTHDIRQRARDKRMLDSSGNSPSRYLASPSHVHVPHLSSMTSTSAPLDFYSMPQHPDELQSGSFPSTFNITPDAVPGPSRSSSLSYPGTPLSATPPLPYSSLRRFPSTESLRPSDSLSMVNDSILLPQRPLSSSARGKQRVSSHGSPVSSEFLSWTDLRKKHFEKRLIRLTASAGLPLSWVENIEWISLCEEFIPGAPSVSRKVLTKRVLHNSVAEIRNEIKKSVKGKDVTLQGDGWTGQNHHHLIAFMVTAEKKVHTVRVHDTSTERKTAENLLRVLEDVFLALEKDWEVTVIAIVTDASGESRKARRLFASIHESSNLIVMLIRQINLIVGDFFKSNSELLQYTELATELITWLRSKTLILGHLPLAVIRAILTRWTAHYTAYRRLLLLQSSLKSLAFGDDDKPENEKVMVTGDAKAKAKARSMVTIIHNALFWHNLALITRYLEPLAIAANIVQASFCRLDEVLLTFGFLITSPIYRMSSYERPLAGVL